MNKALKETIKNEYAKAWNGEKMQDFCTNQVSGAITLSDGKIIIFEKQKIETNFCFGYSDSRYDTEDYNNANAMAHHAATNEDYFRQENLKSYDENINILEGKSNILYKPFIERQSYTGETAPLNLYKLAYMNYGRYLETENNKRLIPLEELPQEDQTAIIEAYKTERSAQEKKVNAYLKRYGLSKVKSWSYWQDR